MEQEVTRREVGFQATIKPAKPVKAMANICAAVAEEQEDNDTLSKQINKALFCYQNRALFHSFNCILLHQNRREIRK
ncbi:MAG: hypothetical protein J6T88_01290 [Bacteroidales bacterium]|nr:hypothetical protein [Bacteroidales bacterium]